MAYTRVYENRITWENYPSVNTPIDEINLNKMDYALNQIDGTLANWDTTKAEQSDMLLAVKTIVFNDANGQITITFFNGTSTVIDTLLEKIAVNFDFDDDPTSAHYQSLIITLDDGTVKYVDMSALITQYEFIDSSTMHFTVNQDGEITVDIIDGSVTEAKLQPNFLADCRAEKTAAQTARTGAETAEDNAEAWAVGQKNGQDVPSTDPTYQNNSKFYCRDSEAWATGKRNGQDVDPSDPTYHNNAHWYSQQTNPDALRNMTDVQFTDNISATDLFLFDTNLNKWTNKPLTVTTGDASMKAIGYQNNSFYITAGNIITTNNHSAYMGNTTGLNMKNLYVKNTSSTSTQNSTLAVTSGSSYYGDKIYMAHNKFIIQSGQLISTLLSGFSQINAASIDRNVRYNAPGSGTSSDCFADDSRGARNTYNYPIQIHNTANTANTALNADIVTVNFPYFPYESQPFEFSIKIAIAAVPPDAYVAFGYNYDYEQGRYSPNLTSLTLYQGQTNKLTIASSNFDSISFNDGVDTGTIRQQCAYVEITITLKSEYMTAANTATLETLFNNTAKQRLHVGLVFAANTFDYGLSVTPRNLTSYGCDGYADDPLSNVFALNRRWTGDICELFVIPLFFYDMDVHPGNAYRAEYVTWFSDTDTIDTMGIDLARVPGYTRAWNGTVRNGLAAPDFKQTWMYFGTQWAMFRNGIAGTLDSDGEILTSQKIRMQGRLTNNAPQAYNGSQVKISRWL